MTITIPFTTIRAKVAAVAKDLNGVIAERRVPFGPGFRPEATSVLVNPQTMQDIQQAWGEDSATE